MKNTYIEQRTLTTTGMTVLAADITMHAYARHLKGRMIIVADEPFLLLRVMRKQWLKLTRNVQRERAQTLKAARIARLSNEIAYMQQVRFALLQSTMAQQAEILFISPAQLKDSLQDVHTAYITCELSGAETKHLQRCMQPNGLIVLYAQFKTRS